MTNHLFSAQQLAANALHKRLKESSTEKEVYIMHSGKDYKQNELDCSKEKGL